MLNMNPITLRTALAQLEQATRDYAVWHANLLRDIIRGAPLDLNDLAAGAHFHCPFGRWYYERAPAELWAQPAFAAIGRKHERLHQVAARLLLDVTAGVPVVREDMEKLLAGCGQLRLELDSLRQEFEAELRERDVLTGANGRTEMLRELRQWHELAQQKVQPCCIVVLDFDHFNAINERYGRQTGDGVLAHAIRQLARRLRPYDKLFRYGDDEFLIALPGTDLATGQAVIKRVRDNLERQSRVGEPRRIGRPVTASFGLASLDPEVSVEESIERAGQALLLAKTAGRNRAICWDPNVTTGTRLPRLRLEDVKG